MPNPLRAGGVPTRRTSKGRGLLPAGVSNISKSMVEAVRAVGALRKTLRELAQLRWRAHLRARK
eukprot:4824118-Pleurochrysis_carterae.AAC.1